MIFAPAIRGAGWVLAQAASSPEPPPAGWGTGVGYVVQHAESNPNVIFPLLAIAGPVIVGCLFIWAAVKFGLPFVKEELAAFRTHTAEMLKRKDDDAAGDLAAARALAAAQHEAIVSRIGEAVQRQTGEFQKISERSERHGEVLRSIAQKVGVAVLLILLVACPAPLTVQQSLAQRVHNASVACNALPVGAAKTETCTKALLCQAQAQAAAEALQTVQLSRAKGDTDVAAETSAAGLSVLAEAACCSWATKPCKTVSP